MRFLEHFAPLADAYDGFIVDLWGVIHDGVKPYPGARETLASLRDAGKRVVLLSNAPRPSAAAQSALRKMGFEDDLYTGVLTSGEATRQALLSPPDDWFATIGPKVLHIGPERDRPTLAGLPFEIADIPEEADFVLNTGPDDHNPLEVSAYEAVLLAARKVGLKMICANPDLEIVRDGVRIPCAGALALRYEELGGDVRAFGKPDAAIYRPVLEMLGLPKERVLAVGDSLRTDIAGAKAAGIDSCWVLGGIHAAELGSDQGLIRGAATEAGLAPVACVPAFVLG